MVHILRLEFVELCLCASHRARLSITDGRDSLVKGILLYSYHRHPQGLPVLRTIAFYHRTKVGGPRCCQAKLLTWKQKSGEEGRKGDSALSPTHICPFVFVCIVLGTCVHSGGVPPRTGFRCRF